MNSEELKEVILKALEKYTGSVDLVAANDLNETNLATIGNLRGGLKMLAKELKEIEKLTQEYFDAYTMELEAATE